MATQNNALIAAVSALGQSGKRTGLVVHSDDQTTWIVPIIEGSVKSSAVQEYGLGGNDITAYLARTLKERALSSTPDDYETIQGIKQKLCYVAMDFNSELESSRIVSSKEANYECSNGYVITIRAERFRAPEAIFQPSLRGSSCVGLHEAIDQAIKQSDFQRDLYANIVLTGGNTLFAGLSERLSREMQRLAPESLKSLVKIYSATKPKRQR